MMSCFIISHSRTESHRLPAGIGYRRIEKYHTSHLGDPHQHHHQDGKDDGKLNDRLGVFPG